MLTVWFATKSRRIHGVLRLGEKDAFPVSGTLKNKLRTRIQWRIIAPVSRTFGVFLR